MADEYVYGVHFGKSDLERVGLFCEMSYMNGKGYQPPLQVVPRGTTRAFESSISKWKTGLQDCYFDQEFKRIFIKEAYSNEFQARLKEEMKNKKKELNKIPFNATFTPKQSSTPGDVYGTFEEKPFPEFSPLTRREKKIHEKKNFETAFPKQGNAGYANIGFDKFPEYKSGDRYDAVKEIYLKNLAIYRKKCKGAPFQTANRPAEYFDPNPNKIENIIPTYKQTKDKVWQRGPTFVTPGPGKKLGGNKSGCFDKYPPHSNEKYLTEREMDKVLTKKLTKPTHDSGIMRPNGPSKPWILTSEIPYNMKFRVNERNWRCVKPFVYFKPC